MITSKRTTQFLREQIKESDPVLQDIRIAALSGWVPVLPIESAKFLSSLVKIHKSKRILEIGMAVGYSAILLCKSMGSEGKLFTIEIDENVIPIAKENFKKADVQAQITIFSGDAKEIVPYISGDFDMIFMDGPKAHYENFLPFFLDLLQEGGLLVCDNVLFHGMVSGDRKIKRRKITIVKRMQHFLYTISHHPLLDTSIIPIGDGISVSIKRKDAIL